MPGPGLFGRVSISRGKRIVDLIKGASFGPLGLTLTQSNNPTQFNT